MDNLKVADDEYISLCEQLSKHGAATQETLQSFVNAMRAVREVGIEDGALVERMDLFITHVEMCAIKPGMYAEELTFKLSYYIENIDTADKSLH